MWGPAAAWAVVLFLLSAWPDPQVPPTLAVPDWIVHAGLYAVLGASLGYGRFRTSAPRHAALIGIAALYGATDEWHQAFVPGRSPEVVDWFADVTGAVVGYVAMLLVMGWLARRRRVSTESMMHVSD